MVGSYSDINKPKKAKGKASQQERSAIRNMLAEDLQKAGYKISKFRAGLILKVSLGTKNPFVPVGDSVSDTFWLKLANNNIYGLGQFSTKDNFVKIASVADPLCAKKVTKYVLDGHVSLLRGRTEMHSEYVDTLNEILEKLNPRLEELGL